MLCEGVSVHKTYSAAAVKADFSDKSVVAQPSYNYSIVVASEAIVFSVTICSVGFDQLLILGRLLCGYKGGWLLFLVG